ncbi:MAG: DUF4340 domain-containing protein, partial [Thermoanaerobaculia bacterium]
MNPRKLLVLTGAVLALFAFIILFERRLPTTEERNRKGPLHWELPADRVESVRVERQNGPTLELKKSDAGVWRVVKPEAYPADAFAAADLARDLASLKRAGGDSAGARPEAYGLHPPDVKATFVWTDESAPQKKKTRTVEFGIEIPGTEVAAARLAGTESVLFVPSSVLAAVKKNPNDFKSREVFGGLAADVASLDIERGRGHLVLSKKSGSWWLQQPVADVADGEAAARLAEELVALRALDFIGAADKDNLATQGLNPPLFRVSLVDAKGVRSTVDLGATRSEGNAVYARRETQVLTVTNTIVDELSKEASAFREAHLVKPDRAAVDGIEGQFPDGSFALGKSGGAWTAAGKPIEGAAAEEVLSALLDLKTKPFLDESDAARLQAQTPAATIRLLMAPEPWELKF